LQKEKNMRTLRALAAAYALFAVLHVSGCAGDREQDATEQGSDEESVAETSSALLGSLTATPSATAAYSINSYTSAKLGISGPTANLGFLQMLASPAVTISGISLKLTCYIGSFPTIKTVHFAGFTLGGGGPPSKGFTASCTSASARLTRATATFFF
jgi:hypothetical protein